MSMTLQAARYCDTEFKTAVGRCAGLELGAWSSGQSRDVGAQQRAPGEGLMFVRPRSSRSLPRDGDEATRV